MPAEVTVLVFARAARPGFTKTRLIEAVGAEGAANLSAAFLDDTLTSLDELPQTVELFAAAEVDRPILEARYPQHAVHQQIDGDLGERMRDAAMRGLRESDAVLIVGSDAPTLPLSHLERAVEALRDGVELVLGPSADGGYTAIGLRSPPELNGVRWSSRETLRDTLRVLSHRRRLLLPPWYDVDTVEDLRLLRTHLNTRSGLAPHTRAVLDRMRFDQAAEPE